MTRRLLARPALCACAVGLALAVAAFVGAGCPPSKPISHPLPHPDGGGAPQIVAGGLASTGIADVAHFRELAYRDGGMLTPGWTLKFLVDRRTPERPVVYFMNAAYRESDGEKPDAAKYHFYLGERVVPGFAEDRDSFSAVTYDTNDKRYIAGSIQTYYVEGAVGPGEVGPSKGEPLYGIQFFPQDVIAGDMVVEAVRVVQGAFRVAGAKLAFVRTGVQQEIGPARPRLEALGVRALTLDDVLGAVDYIPLNTGEAWGFLRMFPEDSDALSATDIPVFKELPLDLTVVAGTITVAYQDPTSHVNLKSKERGTPNMVLRSAGPEHAALADLRDRPVHLSVEVDGFRVEPATEQEVARRLAEATDKPWVTLPYEPTDALLAYHEMCPRDPADCLDLTSQVGAKAAMLGFLTSPAVLGRVTDAGSLSARFGYDLVPRGVGVPFKVYRDLVDHPANTALRRELEALIRQEKAGTLSPLSRKELALRVQSLFYAATLPAGVEERLRARLAEVLPGVNKLKVRSSANAEDMPGFDGAGLYTSFAANLSKTDDPDGACREEADGDKLEVKPKTLACAIKGVFASVWNKRAIDERTYARLDHESAMMGLAIVSKYDIEEDIAANAVVVTRVISSRNVYGYTFASQVGNALVTNPTRGTLAESTIAAFTEPGDPPSFAVTRFAVPEAGKPPLDHTVMTTAQLEQMVQITRHAEIAYCQARVGYYGYDCRYAPADPRKERALDFELKLLSSGRFVCKQMREFSGQ